MAVRIIKLSREDLYEKVWRSPLTTVANEYGISSNGLKKYA
jgi:hypothetical protein